MLTRYDETWTRGTHIIFRNLGKMNGSKGYQRKTNVYEVTASADNFVLGRIAWYSRWRKYVFEPSALTIYEETCMRDISQFIEEETKAQREQAKARKEKA
jgi:hypothetical protein